MSPVTAFFLLLTGRQKKQLPTLKKKISLILKSRLLRTVIFIFCCVVFVLIFVSARQHEVFMITGQGNWNDSLGREFIGRKIKVGNGYGIVKEYVDTKKMFLVFWPLSNSYSMTKIENEGPTVTYLDAAYDIGEAKKKRVAASASSTPVSSQKTSTPSKPLETLKNSETVMPSDKKKAVLEIPESKEGKAENG